MPDADPTPPSRLTHQYLADGYHFAVPGSVTVTAGDVEGSAVITDDDDVVLIATAIETSAVDTPQLQIPGHLGLLVRTYEQSRTDVVTLDRRALTITGSDEAVLQELEWGAPQRHHGLIACARLAGPRLVTLQVIFPVSETERLLPLGMSIVESLVVDPLDRRGGMPGRRTAAGQRGGSWAPTSPRSAAPTALGATRPAHGRPAQRSSSLDPAAGRDRLAARAPGAARTSGTDVPRAQVERVQGLGRAEARPDGGAGRGAPLAR